MKSGMFASILFLAALPLAAGTLFTVNPALPTPTNAGSYGANQILNINVTGTIDLLGGDGLYPVNPDGSIAIPSISALCTNCFTSFYAAYVNPGSVSTLYPTGNPFAGGGTNFDLAANVFAAEGKPTLDATDPGVIRLGALAYTFAANPTATDWKLLGASLGGGLYGGTISTGTGGILKVIVVDTAYWNNTGSFTADITAVATPEPSAAWLALSGIALLGLSRITSRRRVR